MNTPKRIKQKKAMTKGFIDIGYVSLNKKGEELCGDKVEFAGKDDFVTLVLADGLGSGVKANILSTLTSKMLCTMITEGISIEDCVETIAKTLPVCKVREVAYSTFTIIHLNHSGEGYIIEFDNPPAILLREGKCLDFNRERKEIGGKTIYFSNVKLKPSDVVITGSDGVIHAGIGMLLNFGWDRKEIKEFLEKSQKPSMSARCLASLLAGACDQLYGNQPGDDTTVAVVKVREPLTVNIMVGPPSDASLDEEVAQKFINSEGKKIVCGGTTSQIVARYLKEEVGTCLEYYDDEIPPIGFIKGIDLVTEGVITVRKLIERAKTYLDVKNPELKCFKGKDGASLLADMLFEQATKVRFFVGRGVNLAHKDLPIDNTMKLYLVKQLAEALEKIGKNVEINYF